MIIDTFLYANEELLLELRLETLWSVVDKFVLVEAKQTHAGDPKPLYYAENKETKFKKYQDKIINFTIEKYPENNDSLQNAIWHRNYIGECLKTLNLNDNDIIIINDVDEIPNPDGFYLVEDVKNKIHNSAIFVDKNYYYYFNVLCVDYPEIDRVENSNRFVLYENVKKKDLHSFRSSWDGIRYYDLGWHFSYIGGVEQVIKKIQSFGHANVYNTEHFTDSVILQEKIDNNLDLFDRNLHYKTVPIDASFPKYILNNLEKFEGYIRR